MKLTIVQPVKSLSKAYLKQSLKREQIELFKANLARMFERIRTDEHEEHLKNIVSDFLKDTWYKQTNEINTSGRADLAIHNGMTSASSVGVLIEVKRPTNKNEMISPERPNAKALHELLHYYMQERYIKENKEIRHLIVCNIHEWYIFDAVDFEKFFFHNQKLVKSYKEWNDGLLVSTNTDWFYQEIAKPFIEKELDELPCTCFDLRDYVGAIPAGRPGADGDGVTTGRVIDSPLQKRLIALYKILSPTHLLKHSFTNDSNSLNREFYSELLHIIGLEEVKEKGKKLIQRKPEGSRNDGSLLENTINVLNVRHRLPPLPEGEGRGEGAFDLALELCITWLNRLLFLKLLEGQLIGYHKGDRSHAFLNSSLIGDFDELNELFFEVLAVRVDERSESVRTKFGSIPYLNSSLFEESDLERATMRVNELKNRLDLPLHGSTVLKGVNGKRLTGSKSTLAYLFEFLDSYDFGAEGSADIQEQNKSIINASVLGLIFEKINGYKDGSFFTPGFITMYICRETIRRAVMRKFNDRYGWNCADITALYNNLDKIGIREANETVNSLKICDPAVGSGHFLVSALNEIIAVKSDLGILADADGKRLRGYGVTIENDELIVTVDDQIFEYNYKDAESQRVQETLFHEKETIIENCLFGVDINPKSVAICRLRLWIELLKNAYYRKSPTPLNPPLSGGRPFAPSLDKGRAGEGLQLETLPNIDINIKCGNSLVSRFALGGTTNLPAVSRNKLKDLTEKYRRHVFEYKLSPANKAQLRKVIDGLKHDLENFGLPNDKDLIALRKKENEVAQLGFAFDKQGTEARQKLLAEVEVLQKRFAEKERLVYNNAFEWRFEFPEVLDEEGEFVGFDAIIGNPPYGVSLQKELKPFYQTFSLRGESYVLFVEKGHELLRVGGQFCYIMPDTYLNLSFTATLREYLLKNSQLFEIVALPAKVFEEAVVDTTLLFTTKTFTTGTFHDGRVRTKSFAKQAVEIDLDIPGRLDMVEVCQWHELGTFNLIGDADTTALLARLDQAFRKVEAFSEMFSGIKVYEVGKGKPSQTEEIRSTKPFTAATRLHDGFHPFYDGKHVGRYSLLWRENNWLNYGPWLAAPRNPDNFIGEKILVRKIVGNTLIATYVKDTSYCNTLLHVLKLKPEASLPYLYLLGILNSRFIGWYYRAKFQISAEDTFPQIMISDILQFPIPEVSESQQAPIIERVQKILTAKSPPAPPSEGGSETDIPQLEAEIDHLVYALYGLTEEEIAFVEGK